MQREIDELEAQKTWELVDLPPNREPLKGRWVYKIKYDKNNNPTYKSRWVVKGFNQIIGLDYLETFSSTCRPENYRLIFILALYNKWPLLQYDIKNAFVHAKIDKEIYVEQPIGFTRDRNLNKVCKLNKALYGLKQSPRLWYQHLLSILKEEEFSILPQDEAIFINNKLRLIIICHVDDLIITGPNYKNSLQAIIDKLRNKLKIQELGPIHEFLGMEIEYNIEKGYISINQNKYLTKIKKRYNKDKLNPVSSPIELGVKLEPSQDQASPEEISIF